MEHRIGPDAPNCPPSRPLTAMRLQRPLSRRSPRFPWSQKPRLREAEQKASIKARLFTSTPAQHADQRASTLSPSLLSLARVFCRALCGPFAGPLMGPGKVSPCLQGHIRVMPFLQWGALSILVALGILVARLARGGRRLVGDMQVFGRGRQQRVLELRLLHLRRGGGVPLVRGAPRPGDSRGGGRRGEGGRRRGGHVRSASLRRARPLAWGAVRGVALGVPRRARRSPGGAGRQLLGLGGQAFRPLGGQPLGGRAVPRAAPFG
mmetsp:Transcript_69676/g.157528  ORF Transcript_69676/g.157528 Transcript_69676/m.157528 type:complete len:264 (+) Transcript_69676:120-911(+)